MLAWPGVSHSECNIEVLYSSSPTSHKINGEKETSVFCVKRIKIGCGERAEQEKQQGGEYLRRLEAAEEDDDNSKKQQKLVLMVPGEKEENKGYKAECT